MLTDDYAPVDHCCNRSGRWRAERARVDFTNFPQRPKGPRTPDYAPRVTSTQEGALDLLAYHQEVSGAVDALGTTLAATGDLEAAVATLDPSDPLVGLLGSSSEWRPTASSWWVIRSTP